MFEIFISVDWLFFFKADILICLGQKSTGVANNISDGSDVFNYPFESWQWANTRTLKPKRLNGVEPSLILFYSCAFPTVTCLNVFCENDYSETSFNRLSSPSSDLHLTLFRTDWAHTEGHGRRVLCCKSGLTSFRGHFNFWSLLESNTIRGISCKHYEPKQTAASIIPEGEKCTANFLQSTGRSVS